MASAEEFFEAVINSAQTGETWWEQFDSVEEALQALKDARKAEIDDHTVACILSITDTEIPDNLSLLKRYLFCLRLLESQLLLEKEE